MTASVILEKLIFFAVNILIARYLDINHYGEYTTALAFASFFSLFTDMGINETLIRDLNYEEEKWHTLFNVVILKIAVSVIIFFVFIGVTFTTEYSHEIIKLILIFGFVRFGDEYLRLYYTYYEGTGGYKLSALYRVFFALSFLGAVILVVVVNGGNKEIAIFRLGVVFFFLIIMTYAISRGKLLRIDFVYIKAYCNKILPFASTFIYYNIINQGNLIVLPLLHGAVYAGIFQNAYIFIATLMFIPASFSRVFIPYLYKHKSDDKIDRFQFAFDILSKVFVLISFYLTVILYHYSDFIITGIFGEKYKASVFTLRVITLSIPFLFNAGVIMLTALDKQRIYSYILRYMALFYTVLNIGLSYFYLDKGTAAAMVITYFLIFIISHFLIHLNSGLSVFRAVVYNLKGGTIFLVCRMAYNYISFEYDILSIATISILYVFLSLLLLLGKDDIRIAREILGR